jgi:DNA-binding response OmpR family regulator
MAATDVNGDAGAQQRADPRGASSSLGHAVFTVLVADPDAGAYHDLAAFCAASGATLVDCRDGAEALFQAGRCFPDVVLLSAQLPVVSAGEVITAIRRYADIHIAVGISAGEADRAGPAVLAGASELLTRPYQIKELHAVFGSYFARAKARRDSEAVLNLGSLQLNSLAHEVRAAGRALELTLMEYELLRYLMVHADRAVTHEQIRRDVWGARGTEASSNTIAVHVRRIRAQLGGAAQLINIRGVGYRLTASSTRRQPA